MSAEIRRLLEQWRQRAESFKKESRSYNHAGNQNLDAYYDGRYMSAIECAADLEDVLKSLPPAGSPPVEALVDLLKPYCVSPQRDLYELSSDEIADIAAALKAAPLVSPSVVSAAEDYARRCVVASGKPFEIGELVNLKAWFYAGARWRDAHSDADVVGPQSSTMAPPVEQVRQEAIDNGNIFVFCDFVDERHRGCVRGAGHNGPHALSLPPYPQGPVLLAASPSVVSEPPRGEEKPEDFTRNGETENHPTDPATASTD